MPEVAAPDLPPRLREVRGGIGQGRHPGPVMTGHERDQADQPARPHGCLGGSGASAFPSALIFCWACCAIVSPGEPPVIAC